MNICEIGINHNGSLDIAKEMIVKAKECGFDVVKFQKRNPDVCVPEKQKYIKRDTPWGLIDYIDYKHKIEFGKNEYDEIDKLCREIGISWTVSVWDIDSLNFIVNNYDVPFIKIPSPKITDLGLIREINNKNIKVIFSTGMSTEEEIDECYNLLDKNNIISILHCNSSYPADYNDINLNNIYTLKYKYRGVDIGYSGHEVGYLPTMIACGMGVSVIERHFTLDKEMWGTDHKCSLDVQEAKSMIESLNTIRSITGGYVIKPTEKEVGYRKKLR